MFVINEKDKSVTDTCLVERGIVAIYKNDGSYVFEYGYFQPDSESILFYNTYAERTEICISQHISKYIMFSKKIGYYIATPQRTVERVEHMIVKGCGNYPYRIEKEYEAIKSFDIFKDRQYIDQEVNYDFAKYLKYTFGVEFETSEGYIPQNICFKDGLIPLRDGSITGIEYSTVVLKGNFGLNLLRQQCEDLRQYTEFNKNCALHIHFGGYPIDRKYIFVLYCLLYHLQNDILQMIPPYSFNTGKYKDNGKDYCAPLPFFDTFEDMYYYMSDNNTNFMGDLYQAHPSDVEHERKWNIHARYHNFNFINMLFYDSAKTLELRFLRPSFNFNKILLWIMIFNGILLYAEKEAANLTLKDIETNKNKYSRMGLLRIFENVYPDNVISYLTDGLIKLKCVVKNQINNGDRIGEYTSFEDKIF